MDRRAKEIPGTVRKVDFANKILYTMRIKEM